MVKIVVNADDFGMSHEKNIAIDELMRTGVCTNTSLVVNMPFTEEAVALAFAGKYQDKVSLHLNLTVGKSLTEDIRNNELYYDKHNFANRQIIKSNNQIYPKYIKEIRTEIEAQIQQFLSYGFELKSLDSHNWIHLRIPVWLAIKPLIKKYGIEIIRPMWEGYKRPEIASKKWSNYFVFFQLVLLRNKEARIIEYSSNIEQFLLVQNSVNEMRYAEVFIHPDIINGEILDTSSSYLKNNYETVQTNVKKIEKYEKITIGQILGRC